MDFCHLKYGHSFIFSNFLTYRYPETIQRIIHTVHAFVFNWSLIFVDFLISISNALELRLFCTNPSISVIATSLLPVYPYDYPDTPCVKHWIIQTNKSYEANEIFEKPNKRKPKQTLMHMLYVKLQMWNSAKHTWPYFRNLIQYFGFNVKLHYWSEHEVTTTILTTNPSCCFDFVSTGAQYIIRLDKTFYLVPP